MLAVAVGDRRFFLLDADTLGSRPSMAMVTFSILMPGTSEITSPPRKNRKVQPVIDGHIYALRNLIERCFSKLNHSRRLATRYGKTAASYIGFVLIASTRLWISHFVNTT